MKIRFFCAIFLLGKAVVWADASVQLLLDRAHRFERMGLTAVAREQYLLIQKKFPQEKRSLAALANLSRLEGERHYEKAVKAKKVGAVKLALLEAERAISADSSHRQAKALKESLKKEVALKNSMSDRVQKDYTAGLTYYQNGQTDRALECFVKVLNIDPKHRGALVYIERIGEKMGTQ